MALRIELWERGAPVDGVEEWWDGVEAALEASEDEFPILDSVNPYGELTIPCDRLADLAGESRRLAETTTGRVRALLVKIADLCARATATDFELRFNGD